MDTTSTLRNVYVWHTGVAWEWRVMEPVSGFAAVGESRAEAVALFEREWNKRSPIQWVDGAPVRSRREDAPQKRAADERAKLPGYAVYKRLAKRFHSDVHPGATFTADQVMVAINELWTAMRGGK
jgi:hypothetical protein